MIVSGACGTQPTLGSAPSPIPCRSLTSQESHHEGTDTQSKARFIERQIAGAPWNFQKNPLCVTELTIPWEFINNSKIYLD